MHNHHPESLKCGSILFFLLLYYQLTLRLVGATLVVALVGFRWLNAWCRLGAHKGRPYIYHFGADA